MIADKTGIEAVFVGGTAPRASEEGSGYTTRRKAEKEREFRDTSEAWRTALLDAELGHNPR